MNAYRINLIPWTDVIQFLLFRSFLSIIDNPFCAAEKFIRASNETGKVCFWYLNSMDFLFLRDKCEKNIRIILLRFFNNRDLNSTQD